MPTKHKSTNHSVYSLNYHIVLVTKYRRKVFFDEVEFFLKKRIREICLQYNWDLIVSETMPDHVHIFVSAAPSIAPVTVAKTIKSITTVDIFRKFKNLKKQKFWGSGLWSRGTYYGSAGSVSAKIIKRYIQNQKKAK